MQIKVPSPITQSHLLGHLFQGLGAAASILALVLTSKFVPEDIQGAIYAFTLIGIIVILGGYIFVIQSRKLHRFADVPQHIHYVAHTIRDVLITVRHRSAENGLRTEDLEMLHGYTRSVLDSVSHCFSIVTGTFCAVCVKEFQDGLNLRVAFRDSHSLKTRGSPDPTRPPHPLQDDTPCSSIFSVEDGCIRVYFCNDVPTAWKEQRYRSPSFGIWGGEPKERKCGFFLLPPKWNLPYKSCLVAPLRYVHTSETLSKIPAAGSPSGTTWCYWGFLCIDARKRNVFDQNRHADLIAACADLLFIYFSELYDIIDTYTKPTEHRL
jgi:hypothetical protein